MENSPISIEIESVTVDPEETTRARDKYISGEIARRRGWSDEYLEEHFVAVEAVYHAQYDHTKTTRSDGDVVMYFQYTPIFTGDFVFDFDIRIQSRTIALDAAGLTWHHELLDYTNTVKSMSLSPLSLSFYVDSTMPYNDWINPYFKEPLNKSPSAAGESFPSQLRCDFLK